VIGADVDDDNVAGGGGMPELFPVVECTESSVAVLMLRPS